MPGINAVNQVGAREDLSDLLVVADSKNTPCTSMCRKSKKPSKVIFDWPVGAIPDPDTASVADGAPVSSIEDLSGNRALLHNRVHKLRRTFGCSEMAEDVNTPAGIDSEFRNSKANALTALKRAIEAVFCGDQDSSLVGTTYTTRGLGSWINNSAQADVGTQVPTAYRTPAGSIIAPALAALTEQSLRDLMQSIYEQTGQMGNWDGLFGTQLKSTISKMTIYEPTAANQPAVVRTFFAKLEQNTLTGVIDVVKGDFGVIRIHPTLWNAYNNTTKVADQKRGYVLDLDDISMCANKLPGYTPLPFDDSGPRGVVTAIIGNKLGSPLKHGKIAAT